MYLAIFLPIFFLTGNILFTNSFLFRILLSFIVSKKPNQLGSAFSYDSGKKKYLSKIALHNKEIYDSSLHGPGSENFIGCTEDYDLWLRLSNICMISHIAEPLSYVRETGMNQSMKMTPEIFQQNAAKIRKRNEQIHSKN